MQHLTIEQRQKLERAQALCESILKESGVCYGGGEVNEPSVAAMSLRTLIGLEEREVFAVLFLDNQHRLLKSEKLFYGTINQTTVHIREIIKSALLCNAAAIIIGHNHPSGWVTPSEADIAMTHKIEEACELMDIQLVDHIIIGHTNYYSLEGRYSTSFSAADSK